MANSGCSIIQRRFYKLLPNKVGKVIQDLDLKSHLPNEIIEDIKSDVTEHRLLIFKSQGILSPEKQLEISQWFGQIESTFYNHPKSPHRDIFRVSNDRTEGCVNVGRTGWHIDGSFQEKPFSHSIYHIIACPQKGATVFAPLTDLIERLPGEKRAFWNRLWMASDRRGKVIHPLIYSHPLSGKQTLCFHLGMTDHYVLDYGTPNQRILNEIESEEVSASIHHEIVKNEGEIQVSMTQWNVS